MARRPSGLRRHQTKMYGGQKGTFDHVLTKPVDMNKASGLMWHDVPNRGTPIAINGMPDHVHLLIRYRADLSHSEMLQQIKGRSSKWINEAWPQRGQFSWQEGYGAFSVSESMKEDVRAYIAGQEEHHRKISFQDEFIAFLKRHGIEYDERYIWD